MSVTEDASSIETLQKRKICDENLCPVLQETGYVPFQNASIIEQKNVPMFKSSYYSSTQPRNNSMVKGLAELNDILENLTVLCKSPVCYNEYMGYNVKEKPEPNNADTNCNSDMCPFTSKYFNKPVGRVQAPTMPCNSEDCPYTKKVLTDLDTGPVADTCGGLTCPYSSKQSEPDVCTDCDGTVETCGGLTCPFNLNNKAINPLSTNGMKDFDGPFGLCGRSSCPFAVIKTEKKDKCLEYKGADLSVPICPYASQVKPEPEPYQYGMCGVCCTYNVPTTYNVPVYSSYDDYGLVKEASRPYSGSTCPYALYKSDRPDALGIDRNLYSCLYGNEVTDVMDSMDKVHMKRTCFDTPAKTSDTQTADSCSCDEADVEPCHSPNCKLTKQRQDCNIEVCPILKVLSFCKECGGVVVANQSKKNGKTQKKQEENDDQRGTKLSKKDLIESSDPAEESRRKSKDLAEKLKSMEAEKQRESKKNKKTKKGNGVKVLYQYPGVELGHRECSMPGKHVPRNMGWLWNLKPQGDLKSWRGYKPGAVPKAVHKMMVQHRRALGIIDPMDYAIRKKKSKSNTRLKSDEAKHAIILKKVNGVYMVTVNPVKDPKTSLPMESPFIECTPMQFKIEKEPPIVPLRQKATTGCPCDEEDSIPSLIEPTPNNSDLEFHFSPPAAIPDLRTKKKKNMQSIETQYNPADIPYAQPANKKKGDGGKKKKEGKGKKGKK